MQSETSLKIQVADAFLDLYQHPARKKVFYGGRGGAKSTHIAEALLVQGIEEPLRILCVREIQKSISLSVYSLLRDKIDQYGLGWFYDVQAKTIIGKNGTQFYFEGLKDHTVDSLKSIERINRCWVEEAHNVSNRSWEILIPSLFRTDNCQLWVSFNTRKTTDPTYIRFVQRADGDTLVKKVSWRDNPWFPEGMDKERLKLMADDMESYLHVWEGEPDTRHDGSVYAKWVDKCFKSGRVVSGIYDSTLPVYTAWDFGWSDNTAIIFWQQSGKETRVIDCYESFNEDVPFYCDVIKSKPYKYAGHFFPSDAGNKLLAAGGRSIVEIASMHGVVGSIIPETTHNNRIEAARMLLCDVWFDEANTVDLINALNSYAFVYNDDLKIFSTKPVHDWSSHYSTAFELMARVVREKREVKKVANSGKICYETDENGKIIAKIDIKAYLNRKAKEE